jgi:ribosomal protein S18 acetylase RimI-like enzyme
MLADFHWFAPVAELLGAVDAAYEAQRPGLGIGDAVDLWMVGLDRRFAQRGIASTLFRVAAGIPRARGFRRVVTECTGHFSQTAARKAGLEERARIAYRDFRFEGRAVFATVEPPHTHTILFECEF